MDMCDTWKIFHSILDPHVTGTPRIGVPITPNMQGASLIFKG